MTEVERGKYIYGIVTVGARGQIVIPKEARDQYDIKPGGKIVVIGDIGTGIALMKADTLEEVALKIQGARGEEDRKAASEELR